MGNGEAGGGLHFLHPLVGKASDRTHEGLYCSLRQGLPVPIRFATLRCWRIVPISLAGVVPMYSTTRFALVCMLIFAAAPLFAADLLLGNVNGYTLDRAGTLQRFDALLVDAGKVVAAGKRTDLAKRAGDAKVVDVSQEAAAHVETTEALLAAEGRVWRGASGCHRVGVAQGRGGLFVGGAEGPTRQEPVALALFGREAAL